MRSPTSKAFQSTIFFVEVTLNRSNINWVRLMAICTLLCTDLSGNSQKMKLNKGEVKLVFEQVARIEEEAIDIVANKVRSYLRLNPNCRGLTVKSVHKY